MVGMSLAASNGYVLSCPCLNVRIKTSLDQWPPPKVGPGASEDSNNNDPNSASRKSYAVPIPGKVPAECITVKVQSLLHTVGDSNAMVCVLCGMLTHVKPGRSSGVASPSLNSAESGTLIATPTVTVFSGMKPLNEAAAKARPNYSRSFELLLPETTEKKAGAAPSGSDAEASGTSVHADSLLQPVLDSLTPEERTDIADSLRSLGLDLEEQFQRAIMQAQRESAERIQQLKKEEETKLRHRRATLQDDMRNILFMAKKSWLSLGPNATRAGEKKDTTSQGQSLLPPVGAGSLEPDEQQRQSGTLAVETTDRPSFASTERSSASSGGLVMKPPEGSGANEAGKFSPIALKPARPRRSHGNDSNTELEFDLSDVIGSLNMGHQGASAMAAALGNTMTDAGVVPHSNIFSPRDNNKDMLEDDIFDDHEDSVSVSSGEILEASLKALPDASDPEQMEAARSLGATVGVMPVAASLPVSIPVQFSEQMEARRQRKEGFDDDKGAENDDGKIPGERSPPDAAVLAKSMAEASRAARAHQMAGHIGERPDKRRQSFERDF
eukprot:Clim_evm19s169 gene=Clim_evmTU19s169